jgi:hypothetical protein
MLMKNPPHPGLSVRLNCLEPFGLSVARRPTPGSACRGPTIWRKRGSMRAVKTYRPQPAA